MPLSSREHETIEIEELFEDRPNTGLTLAFIAQKLNRSVRYAHSLVREAPDKFTILDGHALVLDYVVRLKDKSS